MKKKLIEFCENYEMKRQNKKRKSYCEYYKHVKNKIKLNKL